MTQGVFITPNVFIKTPKYLNLMEVKILNRMAVVTVFIVMPILTLWTTITVAGEQPNIQIYYWFSTLLSIFTVPYLYRFLPAVGVRISDLWILSDTQAASALREPLMEGSEKLEEEKKRRAYKTRRRTLGTGPLRIGKEITFSEDIYSMLYVSTFNSGYIYFSTETQGDEAKEEAMLS